MGYAAVNSEKKRFRAFMNKNPSKVQVIARIKKIMSGKGEKSALKFEVMKFGLSNSGNESNYVISEKMFNLQDNLNHINLTRKAVCVQENSHARFIDHENIYNAIKNRDSKMARKSMQYHFKDLMDTLHNMSEQKALDEAKNKALNIRKRFNITDHT